MKSNKGFSLVELVIVIAIMAILVGLFAPNLLRMVEKTKVSQDVQLADSIKKAVELAMSDPDVVEADSYVRPVSGEMGKCIDDAGQVLGLTKKQVFGKIVLFQVIKRIVAPMGNEIITLAKDTSLARVISVTEIIMCAERFTKQGLIYPLFSTGLFFLAFCGILTLLLNWVEKKFDYYKG